MNNCAVGAVAYVLLNITLELMNPYSLMITYQCYLTLNLYNCLNIPPIPCVEVYIKLSTS